MNITQVTSTIYRSAQPQSAADFEQIMSLGITAIIDLENESGESPWEKAQWMHYSDEINFHSFPLSSLFPPKADIIDQILKTMYLTPNHEKILVHCLHGQDRSGLICGLYRRKYQGWSRCAAWREMLDRGFHPILLGLSWYYWTA